MRRFLRKFWLPLAVLTFLGIGVGGELLAQPGITPNFIFTRGAALLADPALVAQGLDTNVNLNLITQGTGVVKINGTPIGAGSAGVFTTVTASGLVTQNGGEVTLWPPSPVVNSITATLKASPLRVFHNFTQTGNGADATEDNLHTFTLPANGLSVIGQSIRIVSWVQNAATANGKRTRIEFGATTICDSTSVAANNNWFNMVADVYMTGAATQKALCTITNVANGGSGAAAAGGNMTLSTPAETLSGTVSIRVTGTSATSTANDILAQATSIDVYPNGQ